MYNICNYFGSVTGNNLLAIIAFLTLFIITVKLYYRLHFCKLLLQNNKDILVASRYLNKPQILADVMQS